MKKFTIIKSVLIVLITGGSLFAAASVYAKNPMAPLKGRELHKIFAGKQILIDGPIQWGGKAHPTHVLDPLVITYFNNGSMSGTFFKPMKKQSRTDMGKWDIEKNTICVQWNHWAHRAQYCLHLYPTKKAYILIDEHNVFSGTIFKDNINK